MQAMQGEGVRRDGLAKRTREEWAFRRAGVVVVSYPKSGRTWLRVLLGKALCEQAGLDDRNVLDEATLARATGLRRIFYTHDGSANRHALHWQELDPDKRRYRHKRVLFLARDPRDVVVSAYFQATRRRDRFEGSLSDFLRSDRFGIRKVLVFYRHWHEARQTPRAFRLLTYEGLHADPAGSLARALDFVGAPPLPPEALARAVDFAGFERLRAMERTGYFESKRLRPGDPGDEESFKVRRGKVGGFRDYLEPEDLAYCDRVIAEQGCALVTPSPGPSAERPDATQASPPSPRSRTGSTPRAAADSSR